MSRQAYLVTYDISDPKRLRRVFEAMRDVGDHLQLSVFRCELSASELVELRDRLRDIINFAEDQILFVDLGPAEGRGGTCIKALVVGPMHRAPEALSSFNVMMRMRGRDAPCRAREVRWPRRPGHRSQPPQLFENRRVSDDQMRPIATPPRAVTPIVGGPLELPPPSAQHRWPMPRGVSVAHERRPH